MEKEIKCSFNWIDDEVASIICPYCKSDVIVGIYRDDPHKCECGKKFVLTQVTKVFEVVD